MRCKEQYKLGYDLWYSPSEETYTLLPEGTTPYPWLVEEDASIVADLSADTYGEITALRDKIIRIRDE